MPRRSTENVFCNDVRRTPGQRKHDQSGVGFPERSLIRLRVFRHFSISRPDRKMADGKIAERKKREPIFLYAIFSSANFLSPIFSSANFPRALEQTLSTN